MTTATSLGVRNENIKTYVVVIASKKTRQSKMRCMLSGCLSISCSCVRRMDTDP